VSRVILLGILSYIEVCLCILYRIKESYAVTQASNEEKIPSLRILF